MSFKERTLPECKELLASVEITFSGTGLRFALSKEEVSLKLNGLINSNCGHGVLDWNEHQNFEIVLQLVYASVDKASRNMGQGELTTVKSFSSEPAGGRNISETLERPQKVK